MAKLLSKENAGKTIYLHSINLEEPICPYCKKDGVDREVSLVTENFCIVDVLLVHCSCCEVVAKLVARNGLINLRTI
jgi:hypothetical protein